MVHRAVGVAAARTGKNVNAWVADVLAAAATTSNAAWLLFELANRGMALSDAARDLARSATKLVIFTGLLRDGENEHKDLITKLEGAIESSMGALAIQAKKKAPKTAHLE